MVNVAFKPETKRSAIASSFLKMNENTLRALRDKTLPKGDALSLAKVAGIQGAKWTSHLIPLCHSLEARHISVELSFETGGVRIRSKVEMVAPTGPEMEALVACSVAGLALYDMCKSMDDSMILESVRLEKKFGGKSDPSIQTLKGRRAVLLTLSDRASKGIYEDLSGPQAAQELSRAGFEILHTEIIPDELEIAVKRLLHFCNDLHPDIILTLGSTGLSTRDIAPEATAQVIDRSVPGISEALRNQSFAHHPVTAFLSRGTAGFRGKILIVNLPGKPSAVLECLALLIPSFPHIFQMISGAGHE